MQDRGGTKPTRLNIGPQPTKLRSGRCWRTPAEKLPCLHTTPPPWKPLRTPHCLISEGKITWCIKTSSKGALTYHTRMKACVRFYPTYQNQQHLPFRLSSPRIDLLQNYVSVGEGEKGPNQSTQLILKETLLPLVQFSSTWAVAVCRATKEQYFICAYLSPSLTVHINKCNMTDIHLTSSTAVSRRSLTVHSQVIVLNMRYHSSTVSLLSSHDCCWWTLHSMILQVLLKPFRDYKWNTSAWHSMNLLPWLECGIDKTNTSIEKGLSGLPGVN